MAGENACWNCRRAVPPGPTCAWCGVTLARDAAPASPPGYPPAPPAPGYGPGGAPGPAPSPGPMGGSGPLPPFDCEICGGTPSKKVSFVQFIGMFVAFQQSRYSHEVCQSCGLALGRKVQNRTLLTGWWGFVSFFANLYAILHNGIRLLQLGRLAAPTEGNPSARLDPGRSAFLRVGAIVPLAIVLVATGAILISMLRGQQVNGLVEGDCVSISTLGPSEKPVPCDGPHDGRIIAVTDTLEECPSRTDEAFAEESGKSAVLCVDTDTAGS